MVKHIVMWKLKEQAEGASKEENAQKVKTILTELKNYIPEILEIEVGMNFNQTEVAYDVVLYSVFESKEALQTYQVHPKHVEAAAFVGKVKSERCVVDYEI